MMTKSYTGLKQFDNFKDRFEYLKLNGVVGEETFAAERYLNQSFYNSTLWRNLRNRIIVRDGGFDMGLDGYAIMGPILIHHIIPITVSDIVDSSPLVTDPNNLICVSHSTHNAIHYGDFSRVVSLPEERTPNDTIPWR